MRGREYCSWTGKRAGQGFRIIASKRREGRKTTSAPCSWRTTTDAGSKHIRAKEESARDVAEPEPPVRPATGADGDPEAADAFAQPPGARKRPGQRRRRRGAAAVDRYNAARVDAPAAEEREASGQRHS